MRDGILYYLLIYISDGWDLLFRLCFCEGKNNSENDLKK